MKNIKKVKNTKNVRNAFSGILVGILLIGGIGLFWFNEGTSANSVKAVKYNGSHYPVAK